MNQAALIEENSSSLLTWKEALQGEKEKPYFKELLAFIERERKAGKAIYPPTNETFAALQSSPFSEVKAVILGQDPYHGAGQAHGLCFSVRQGVPPPPSLINIFKELKSDLGIPPPNHGCLEKWAQQGVLLLNAVLSVEASKPGSHAKRGWEMFTDRVVKELNEKREGLVFLLWGAYAQKKGEFIDRNKHLVLACAHPSPFSADRGFFGCRHFSQTNAYLAAHGRSEIDWRIA